MVEVGWLLPPDPNTWVPASTSNELEEAADERSAASVVSRCQAEAWETLRINGHHALTSLACDLGHLNACKAMDLSMNLRLQHLSPSVSYLFSLSVVDLSYCSFEEVPEGLCCLQCLTELDLSNNRIKSIPPSVSGMKRLSVLCLDGNQVSSVPAALQKLGLKCLELAHNPLLVKGQSDASAVVQPRVPPLICDFCRSTLLATASSPPLVRLTFVPCCGIEDLPVHHFLHRNSTCG
eukprot:Rhum_TRINITY_DN25788_c0_g1::Rhum_TRINITY_DN25788_c0_g1_i1::g.182762::m.182762